MIGRITSYSGSSLTIEVPYDDTGTLQRQGIHEAEIRLVDGRQISPEQRKKVYALLRNLSDYTGYPEGPMKEEMKYAFLEKTGDEYFSLSDTDMTTARHFIDFLVEFCLYWSVPCRDSLLSMAEDIRRYLYLCLYHRKCCICGVEAVIQHCDRIGMGGNRNTMSHIGYEAMALCQTHHDQAHQLGQTQFDESYHVFGIPLDKILVRRLKLGITDNERSWAT